MIGIGQGQDGQDESCSVACGSTRGGRGVLIRRGPPIPLEQHRDRAGDAAADGGKAAVDRRRGRRAHPAGIVDRDRGVTQTAPSPGPDTGPAPTAAMPGAMGKTCRIVPPSSRPRCASSRRGSRTEADCPVGRRADRTGAQARGRTPRSGKAHLPRRALGPASRRGRGDARDVHLRPRCRTGGRHEPAAATAPFRPWHRPRPIPPPSPAAPKAASS
jgi:hypothetical protein